jgi:tryptophan synthase alpha chain
MGADIIELGVPFSDPLADGPLIQEASQAALAKNTHLIDILKLSRQLRPGTDVPLCLMTYYNPIFCFGQERFIQRAKAAGIDGVIIPDLPPDEGKEFLEKARKSGLDVISFLSPTTTRERAKFIAHAARGFIYYVSLTGVTGPRKALPPDLVSNLRAVKRLTDKPLCVGFGISSRAQVEQLSRICDGVIVGSAIIKKIKENLGRPDLVKRVGIFVKSLVP